MDKKRVRCQQFLERYEAPDWMAGLQNIPTHNVKIGLKNTPIERWDLPGVPDGFEVYIKREDLTGSVLTGNKVQGLKFVLADAIHQGCTSVIASASNSSNYLRTLAVMASLLGMQAHLLIHSDKNPDNNQGNNLVQRMMGAHRYLVPDSTPYADIIQIKKQLAEKIRKETGAKSLIIDLGEDKYIFGDLEIFNEMMSQGLDSFTDVVAASAGGATAGACMIGNYLTGNKLKIHAMITMELPGTNNGTGYIDRWLRYIGLQTPDGTGLQTTDAMNIIEGPIGAGYGISTPDELEFVNRVARQTGILLGPIYSGKAAYHLVKQLNTNPQMFKGKKILFMHTGGLFDIFDGRMQNAFSEDSKIQVWKDIKDDLENGRLENGHLENGHLENGRLEKGRLANGHLANGHLENGRLANGHLANGHLENGHLENGRLENGRLENGRLENGHLANGHLENGHLENGRLENGRLEIGHLENGHL